jgi:hypothetical protein
MVRNDLQFAGYSEIAVQILSKPDDNKIARLQGYKSAKVKKNNRQL